MGKSEIGDSIEDYLLLKKPRKVLVCGIGGGGDVLATLPTVNYLRTLNQQVLIGAVVWERWVVDPKPGPISIEELVDKVVINDTIALVNENTYAVRDGKKIVPQLVKVAKELNEPLVAIDVSKGVKGVVNGLNDFSQKYQIDLIIGVDGGGDVLAVGGEEDLWSPVADQIMLSALGNLNIPAILAVFGIGTDGELSPTYILHRLSEIAKSGGYLGVRGLTKKDIRLLERLLEVVITETNRAALSAAKGTIGKVSIRSGSREVDLSLGILAAVTVYLDTHIVYNQSNMAKAIRDTTSVWEVHRILNDMGIFTEIDLEYGVLEYLSRGMQPDLNAIKENWEKSQKEMFYQ